VNNAFGDGPPHRRIGDVTAVTEWPNPGVPAPRRDDRRPCPTYRRGASPLDRPTSPIHGTWEEPMRTLVAAGVVMLMLGWITPAPVHEGIVYVPGSSPNNCDPIGETDPELDLSTER
jgi:hypothetical protein